MGGQEGMRGYLIQTIIAVLESLDKNDWKSVCIEPTDEEQKVDIKWTYEDGAKSVYQVKSSKNPFTLSDAKTWSNELIDSTPNAKSYTLFLVGRLSDNLYKNKSTLSVDLHHKDLDFESLNAQIIVLIEKFYSGRNKGKITYGVRDILANSLTLDFAKSSIVGKVIIKNEFENLLLSWIASIEKMASQNPYLQFIPTQEIKQTTKNHEMIKNILRLIGWDNLKENEKVDEINEETGEEITYEVDFSQKWESKLKDNEVDNVFVSAILDSEYPLNPKEQLARYLINSNKVIESFKDKGATNSKEQMYFNILFWLSLNNQEINTDFNFIAKEFYKSNLLDAHSTYLMIDNARANFLISSIIAAKNYNDCAVKFLYPITEENSSPKKIGKRGIRLPPQYINASILPIIKESAEKISILIFCNDEYSAENLKKVIWLIIRLTSGFGNEYVIYFPDYKEEYLNQSNTIIADYNDELLTQKIHIKSMSIIEYTSLGNLPQIEEVLNLPQDYNEENEKSSVHINDAFMEQLPYGDILKPFLKTDLISSNDLKIFLSHRGFFFKNSDKKRITNLMTTLLFTPFELQNFIRFINKKERPVPIVPIIFQTIANTSISDVFKICNPNFAKVTDGISSRLLDPIEFKPEKENPNVFVFESYVEVKDPTKQISVNTQCYPIKISCRNEGDNMIITNMEANCKDGKTIGRRIIKEIENELLSKRIIQNESIKIKFNSFVDNIDRVNFLLSFTKIDDSTLFREQDIKSVKYNFDEVQDVPEIYKDKTNKDIVFILRGKGLSGISEISEIDFKKVIFLEEVEIKYTFDFRGIIGYYNVKYNFSNALKNNESKNGEFRTEPYLHYTHSLKNDIKNSKVLEQELKEEIEKMKINRFKQFNLI